MSNSNSEPSNFPSQIGLNEVGDEYESDPLQLNLSDEQNQDSGLFGSSEPEIIRIWKRFTCDVCGYQTDKKSIYDDHMRAHRGERPFACDSCAYRSSSKKILSKHKKRHHQLNLLRNNKAVQKSDLSRHMYTRPADETANDPLRIQCHHSTNANLSLCDSEFHGQISGPSESSLPKNVPTAVLVNSNSIGNPLNNPLTMQKNELCDKDSDLRCETLRSRFGGKLFACDICEYTADRKSRLSSHIARAHFQVIEYATSSCDYKATMWDVSNVTDVGPHVSSTPHTLGTSASEQTTQTENLEPTDVSIKDVVMPDPITERTTNVSVQFMLNEEHDECPNDSSRGDLIQVHELPNHPLQLEVNEDRQDSGASRISKPDTIRSGNKCCTFYTCVCGHETNKKSDMEKHMRTHTEEKRFSCEACGFETRSRYNLENHMMTHTVYCDFCGKMFPEKRSLDNHKKVHIEEKQFSCWECSYRTTYKWTLAVHMKSHIRDKTANETSEIHLELSPDDSDLDFDNVNCGLSESPGKSLTSDELFRCMHCDYKCVDKTGLNQHVTKHIKEKGYRCDDCGYETKYKRVMDGHKMYLCSRQSTRKACKSHVTQEPSKTRNATLEYSCDICNYRTTDACHWDMHKVIHMKLYACNICDYTAQNKRILADHMTVTHKQFSCTICEYKVDEESLLLRHIVNVHADVEEYICYSCDYKARNAKAVEQHILSTHTKADTAPSAVAAMTPTNDARRPISTEPEVVEYYCYACDYKASEVAQVEDHILSTHPTALSTDTAALHMDLNYGIHGNYSDASTSSDVGSVEYFCFACDYKASNVVEVEQHILSNHNPFMPESTSSPMDVTSEASTSSTSQ